MNLPWQKIENLMKIEEFMKFVIIYFLVNNSWPVHIYAYI